MAHSDLFTAALWLAITAVNCFQWYWQGRRDQQSRDKKIIDKHVADLVEQVDDILRRHHVDPNRPNYLDRQ